VLVVEFPFAVAHFRHDTSRSEVIDQVLLLESVLPQLIRRRDLILILPLGADHFGTNLRQQAAMLGLA
jgi:hypothetical protein